MDLAELVSYEKTFTFDLRNPATDEPVGVTISVRSISSDAVKRIERAHIDEDALSAKPASAAKLVERQCERVAATIVSWDWGAHTFGGKAPKLEDAPGILQKNDWIYLQVAREAGRIANFTAK